MSENPTQIATHAYNAGVTNPVDLIPAVAIAMAESGGNERAHNAVPPDDSYGLWQINMLGALGPQRRAEFGITSNDDLYDPGTNAHAMFKISGGGKNWSPWSTYRSARYYLYLPLATAGADAALTIAAGKTVVSGGQAAVDSVTSTADAAAQGIEYLAAAGRWVGNRHNWARIGYAVAGVALVVAGAFLVVREPAAGVGKAVAPIVGAAKKIKTKGA